MALIVEVLDAQGEVRSRHRLGGTPLTVGRGYDNDIVLDDPYADVRHARIGEDEPGTVAVTDQGSVNGLRAADGRRHTRLAVGPGTVVGVGRTRLRFRDPDGALPPALVDAAAPAGERTRLARLDTVWAYLGVTAAALGVVAWATWIEDYAASPTGEVVNTVLGALIVGVVWAGIWAVAGRVVVQRFRFPAHLATISVFVAVALLYGVATGWTAYLFPDQDWPDMLGGAAWFGLVAVLVAGHLRLASALSRRRRWTAGLVTSVVLFGVAGLVALSDDEGFTDVATFSADLRPLAGPLLPTVSVEEFDGVAETLIAAVREKTADRGRE